MFWPYFHSHYQDNVVAGFINSFVVIGLTWVLIIKKMLVCSRPWCLRLGHHKVDGTHYRTCNRHATFEIHRHFRHRHSAKYPQQHKFLKGEYERS